MRPSMVESMKPHFKIHFKAVLDENGDLQLQINVPLLPDMVTQLMQFSYVSVDPEFIPPGSSVFRQMRIGKVDNEQISVVISEDSFLKLSLECMTLILERFAQG